MQNIYDILKGFDIEIPEGKKADFDKAVLENYKTVAEVKNLSDKLGKTEEDLAAERTNAKSISDELASLQNSNATADGYKAKFEELEKKVRGEQEAAQKAQAQAEKDAAVSSRFGSVCVDKEGNPLEFNHDAIETAYIQKFGEALGNNEFTGKSDADIFHELTKDDATAFKTPRAEVLAGANPMMVGGEKDTDILRKAMGLETEK